MKNIYLKTLQRNLEEKNTVLPLPMANLVKICDKDFKFEKYIEIIQGRPLRVTITKFRISDHALNIEKGRHKGITNAIES